MCKKFEKTICLFIVLPLIVSLIMLSSCRSRVSDNNSGTQNSIKVDTLEFQNVNFVYSQRMNSSANLTESNLASYALASLNAKYQPKFYSCDGSPKIVLDTSEKSDYAVDTSENNEKNLISANTPKAEKIASDFLSGNDSKAQSAESDAYDAIYKSAQSLKSNNNGKKNTIVVCDSGIATTGEILNFANKSIQSITIDDVDTIQFCPDLSGIDNIVWFGFNQTCDGQNQLKSSKADNMKQVIKKYFVEKCHVGNVEFNDNTKESTNSHSGLPKVTIVDFNSADYSSNWSTIEVSNTEIKFKPNSSELENESAANEVLQKLAASIKQSGSNVTVNGYVAINGQSLSQERADKVKSKLVEFGCDASKITAVGKNKGKYPDMTPYNPANVYVEIVKS